MRILALGGEDDAGTGSGGSYDDRGEDGGRTRREKRFRTPFRDEFVNFLRTGARQSAISFYAWTGASRRCREAGSGDIGTDFVTEFDKTLAAGSALGAGLGVGAEDEEDEAEFEEGADGIVAMRGDEIAPNDLRSRDPHRPLRQLRPARLHVFERGRFHQNSLTPSER